MSVREYIGARYIPLFADPIEWDSTRVYEPLTVVKYQGASYVSRQSVPGGIQLSNTDYWILWADYNAQIEAYRQEVQAFDGRITQNTEDIDDLEEDLNAYKTSNNAEIAAIKANNWVTTPRIAANAVTADKIAKERYILIGDSWGQGYTPDGNVTSWIDYLTAYLNNTNVDVSSSAVGGAGLVNGTNYLQQLQTVSGNLTSAQKTQVTKIVCVGGYNDINRMSQSDANAAATALKNYATTNYPRADLILISIGSCNYAITGIMPKAIAALANEEIARAACKSANLTFVGACQLLDGIAGWSSDGYHPAASQQTYIAQFVKNTILGLPYNYRPLQGDLKIHKRDETNTSSSAKFVIENTIMNPCDAISCGFYIMGTLNFETEVSFTFNGANSITLQPDETEIANCIKNMRYNQMLSAICKVDNKYYLASGLLHQVNNATAGINFLWYPLCLNDAHTGYLTGTFQSIEFI